MEEERAGQAGSGNASEKEAELRELLFKRLSDLRAQTGVLPASISTPSPPAQSVLVSADGAVTTAEKEEAGAPKDSGERGGLTAPSVDLEDVAEDDDDEDYEDDDEDYEDEGEGYEDEDEDYDAVLASKAQPDQ